MKYEVGNIYVDTVGTKFIVIEIDEDEAGIVYVYYKDLMFPNAGVVCFAYNVKEDDPYGDRLDKAEMLKKVLKEDVWCGLH